MGRILCVLSATLAFCAFGCSKSEDAAGNVADKEDQAPPAATHNSKTDELIAIIESDKDEAEIAIVELMEQGPEQSALGKEAIKKELDSKNPRTRVAAAIALFQLDPTNEETLNKVVEVIVRALTDPDPDVQREALSLVSRAKRANEEQIKAIATALENENEYVSTHAAYASAMMGERTVPLLVELTTRPKTVLLALLAIQDIGPPAKPAQEAVAQAAKDPDSLVRREAALALGEIQADAAVAMPVLTSLLDDKATMVQMAAAQSLVAYGAEAKPALEKLQVMTKSEDIYTRLIGALTIIALEPPSEEEEAEHLADVLAAGLEDEHRVARLEAVKGLAKLRSAASAARPKLEELASDDKDEEVKKAAAEALKVISP